MIAWSFLFPEMPHGPAVTSRTSGEKTFPLLFEKGVYQHQGVIASSGLY
jgi:hypothetical protein